MASDKPLVYVVSAMEATGLHDVMFTIDIVDEYTLQQMERRYPGKLTFDGGRTFTLRLVAPIKGLSDRDPAMWTHMLKNQPEIVRAFVLERLKGNI